MDTIITLTAEDMQEKSLNSNIEEVRLALISIDKRLKSASIRELESHSILYHYLIFMIVIMFVEVKLLLKK